MRSVMHHDHPLKIWVVNHDQGRYTATPSAQTEYFWHTVREMCVKCNSAVKRQPSNQARYHQPRPLHLAAKAWSDDATYLRHSKHDSDSSDPSSSHFLNEDHVFPQKECAGVRWFGAWGQLEAWEKVLHGSKRSWLHLPTNLITIETKQCT